MKKMLSLVFLLSSALFAGHDQGLRYSIGGRAGVASSSSKICIAEESRRDANPIPTTGLFAFVDTLNADGFSFQSGAFAEVGYRVCDWSFGALCDVNGDTLNTTAYDYLFTKQFSSSSVSPRGSQNFKQYCVRAPLHIGGDLRAGSYISNALWYVLIGAEAVRMRFNHYVSDPSLIGAANVAVQTTVNPVTFGTPCVRNNDACGAACGTSSNCNTFWKGALRVGTGVEYNLSDCFNLKLEYRFVLTGKKQINFASPVVAGFANQVAENAQILAADTFSFRQSVTALMFSYQF